MIIAVMGLVSITGNTYAQKQIPAPVKEAFAKSFPNATKVKWEKEDANYEAEFHDGATEFSAVYSATGTWMETEEEIAVSNLPQGVKDYLAKHYAGKKVKEASKITHADGSITYEAEINGKDLLFDANGNLLP